MELGKNIKIMGLGNRVKVKNAFIFETPLIPDKVFWGCKTKCAGRINQALNTLIVDIRFEYQ